MKSITTLAFFSQKGGSGKTTLAIHTAVVAHEAKQRVVLIDCDPQESTTRWGLSREKRLPFVAKATPSDMRNVLDLARHEGYTLAVLDCPPHMTAGAAQLIAPADYVLVPCQPTALDISATASAVAIIQATRRPFAFIINRAPYRAPENQEALDALRQQGTVCPSMIGDRRAFSRALTGGQAVTEFDSKGKSAQEIRALWRWIRKEMTT
jgi:chromosome partitioning protein